MDDRDLPGRVTVRRSTGQSIAAPSTKPGTQVSLVIIPQDFAGPDWGVTYQPIAP